jgi:hypothetical protein
MNLQRCPVTGSTASEASIEPTVGLHQDTAGLVRRQVQSACESAAVRRPLFVVFAHVVEWGPDFCRLPNRAPARLGRNGRDLAEHPRLPRRDALKVLPADISADPDYRARFNREARPRINTVASAHRQRPRPG